jgi:glyoxylase-like metal-dependent hydrolase (beta-lactamase superfamily II)
MSVPASNPDNSPERASVRYRWKLLRAGEFRLDGGAMFGLIPRVVWSKAVPVDDLARITVQHNCLLLERVAGPHDAPGEAGSPPRRVLIETGTGDKLDAKNRAIFALGERSITDALLEAGTRPEDIDAVVVSHLHFDHAGGLTRLCRQGETPDWTGPASSFGAPRPDHAVKLTFPNAKVHVQAREWLDAIEAKSVMTRTYFADHLEPIRAQVVLTDSPRPFAPGIAPGRDATPPTPAWMRMREPVPGIRVLLVPGHTWGQQAVGFTDEQGRFILFTPDVMPTAAHVGAAYSLAYDVEPYTSMLTRRWLLDEAAAGGWILVLDHEPGDPVRRVIRNDKGWFDLQPVP